MCLSVCVCVCAGGGGGRVGEVGGLQLELHGHEICLSILKADNCSAIIIVKMYTKSQTANHASLSANSGLLPILELLLQILDLLLAFEMVEHSHCFNANHENRRHIPLRSRNQTNY